MGSRLSQGHREVSQLKDACLGPLVKRWWATWALESTLFLGFASPQEGEAEVLIGGHQTGLGCSSSLGSLGLEAPMD